MSFPIQLMKNTDPYNKVNKSPVAVTTVSGELKANCTIVDPVITIQYDSAFINANYAYIPEFGRYYFIKNAETPANGLWTLTMHTDVLMSFASSILNSPTTVSRSSNNCNMFLNDDHYGIQETRIFLQRIFRAVLIHRLHLMCWHLLAFRIMGRKNKWKTLSI